MLVQPRARVNLNGPRGLMERYATCKIHGSEPRVCLFVAQHFTARSAAVGDLLTVCGALIPAKLLLKSQTSWLAG